MWVLAILLCVMGAGYYFYINTKAYIESGLVTTIDTTTAPLEVKDQNTVHRMYVILFSSKNLKRNIAARSNAYVYYVTSTTHHHNS